jgi:pimeloyl-ACP methyl ester carboxylesterase
MTRRGRRGLLAGNEEMHVGEGTRDEIHADGRAGRDGSASMAVAAGRGRPGRAGSQAALRAVPRRGVPGMSAEWAGWDRRESGPADAEHTALLLPGGLCTYVQYEELMAEPALAGVRMIAVTLPGNGGTPALPDLSIENLARLTAQCAADLGCDVVVGFSLGANIALEMTASGAFSGPLVLLAPSFSRRDEAVFLRILDRLARVLGYLPFAAMLRMMGPAMKAMPLPPDRRRVLAAELGKNDPRVARRGIHSYLRYLDRHGSVAPRLCQAGVPAWVVHGERGDGGITPEERRTLGESTRIHLITIPGASYFTPNEEPALVAKLVVEALDRERPA